MKIYTDGSFGSGGSSTSMLCGGIGISTNNEVLDNLSIHVDGSQLNNILIEALAIRTAFILYSHCPIIQLYTDSDHCYNSLIASRDNYTKYKWLTTANKPIAEFDILIQCAELIRRRDQAKKTTKIKLVKGHSGDNGNTIADNLAFSARLTHGKVSPIFSLKINVPSDRCNSVAEAISMVAVDLIAANTELNSTAISDTANSALTHSTNKMNCSSLSVSSAIQVASKPLKLDTKKYSDGTLFAFCLLCTRIVRTIHIKCNSTAFTIVGSVDVPQIITIHCKTCKLKPHVQDISNCDINGLISTLLVTTSPVFNMLKLSNRTSIIVAESNNSLLSMPIHKITDKCSTECCYNSVDTNTGNNLQYLNGGFL